MRKYLLGFLLLINLHPFLFAQLFSPKDYCLVWSDEFDLDGAPNTSNWGYEQGCSVRNSELEYYTNNRRENARVENGKLIIEARKETMGSCNYTSASLTTSGKRSFLYGRFEMRAKIDTRNGSWPAFWMLGVSGEWPSNGEIDIMEFYNKMIHANVAWGTETRWQANWNSNTKLISDLGAHWVDSFHVWRMEWTPQFIYLYVDDILMNTTDLSKTINGSISNIVNPFQQKQYIVINEAIGGNNGGDPSGTTFPVQYIIDYVRVYQKGTCHLDCNWQEGGSAHLDDCLRCVGGTTGKTPCVLKCSGNMIPNPGFESGGLAGWTGWGTRSAGTTAYSGKAGVQVGAGAIEGVITVLPNTPYTLTAKAEKSGGGWYRLGVKEYGGPEKYTEQTNTTWGTVSLNFTTGDTTSARIYFYNGTTGTAYGDDFNLQPSGCLVITGNETEELESLGIRLFPNPSDHSFQINVPKEGTIQVYNISGILVAEMPIANSLNYGQNLKSGTYYIKYSSESVSKVISWVKL
jgi:beta-glucanase (GH16 family)